MVKLAASVTLWLCVSVAGLLLWAGVLSARLCRPREPFPFTGFPWRVSARRILKLFKAVILRALKGILYGLLPHCPFPSYTLRASCINVLKSESGVCVSSIYGDVSKPVGMNYKEADFRLRY